MVEALIGLVMFFNFAVIYLKATHDRQAEAVLDAAVYAVVIYITSFAGQGGMYVGTIASALFSILLYFSPPSFALDDDETQEAT